MTPEVLDALEAIDATLAGEAVDPSHAELAELALLLRSDRGEPTLAFAAEMDQRVRERFAPRPASVSRRPRRFWLLGPTAGLAASVLVAIVIVVTQGGATGPVKNSATSAAAAGSTSAASSTSVASSALAASSRSAPRSASAPATLAVKQAAGVALASHQNFSASSVQGVVLAPVPNGRRITQGAQLALNTSPSRVDTVAQEVFQVAGRENAIVQNSNVTATQAPGGYAQFRLSVPSASLPQAMAALSTLRYARVAARTDSTQDVNNQYLGDVRALGDARALRTGLLKQLAAASTQAEIDSLTARIHDADASISSDEATLRGLNHQIAFSQVNVTINAGVIPVPVKQSSGFTLRKAVHDAGRVLTVAAGVALIGAAAMLPLGLLAGLGWWVRTLVVRRRREHALDLV